MKPKVSIVLPVFNNEKTIGKNITSLLGQKYKNKEIIAVDDGSIDNSLDVLKKFKKVKVIPIKHKNRSHARNIGLKVAKGKFVFFAEADAYYSKNYLASCLETVGKNPKIGSVAGRLLVWNNRKFLPKCKEIEREYASMTRKPKAGWFYLRNIIKNGFDEKLDFGEDVDLANKLRKKRFLVEWCKEAKWYHMEPESLSEEFKRNFCFGKNMSQLFIRNKKLAVVEILKSFYYPLVSLFGILSIINSFFILPFLALLSIFVTRFMKFSIVGLGLGYDVPHVFFVPVMWFVRSYARLVGLILAKFE